MDSVTEEEDAGGGERPAQGEGVGTSGRIRERRLDKLVLHAQRTSLCPPDLLEQKRRERPVAEGGISYALLSSRPVQDALRVPWLHRLGLLVSVPILCLSIYNATVSWSAGQIPPYRRYRFTSLESRNGSTTPQSPGIAAFGLMSRGEMPGGRGVSLLGRQEVCRAGNVEGGGVEVKGASLTLKLPAKGEDEYRGWYIRTLEEEGSQGRDAVRFVLEGSDNMVEWAKVGSSTSASHLGGVVFTDGDPGHRARERGVPEGRGRVLVLNAVIDQWYWVSFSLCDVLLCACLLAGLALAAAGRADLCERFVFRGGLWALAAARVCLGAVMLRNSARSGDDGLAIGGLYSLLLAALDAFGALVLTFAQEAFDAGLLTFAALQLGLEPYFGNMLFEAAGVPPGAELHWGAVQASRKAGHAAVACAGLLVAGLRVWVVVRAHMGIAPGRAAYMGAWGAAVEGQEGDLERLRETVRGAAMACRGAATRQLNHPWHAGAAAHCRPPKPGVPPPEPPSNRVVPRTPETVAASLDTSGRPGGSLDASAGPDSSVRSGPPLFPTPPETPSSSSRELQSPVFAPPGPGPFVSPSVRARRSLKPMILSRVPSFGWNNTLDPRNESVRTDFGLVGARDSAAHPRSHTVTNLLQSTRFGAVVMREGAQSARGRGLGGPVRNLDQLYSQAFLAQDVFLDYVVRVAAEHGGKFRLRRPEGGIHFDSWDGGEASRGRFTLGGVKGFDRAVSKASLCHRGDASLLTDFVREALHFDTVAELDACLRAVVGDPTVEVARVTSTMQPPGAFDPKEAGTRLWAGMPFVKVNLRLAGVAEARELCADAHVCELILSLSGVARVQTQEMRRAYREWRCCRRVLAALSWRPWHRGARGIGTYEEGTPPPRSTVFRSDSANSTLDSDEEARPLVRSLFSASSSFDLASGFQRTLSAASSASDAAALSQGTPTWGAPVRWRGGTTSFGMAVSENMEELLVGLCRLSETDHGFESSSLSGLFYARHPITAASTRLPTQVFLLGLGSYVLSQGIVGSMNFEKRTRDYAFGPYRHYRLQTMKAMNGSTGAEVAGPGVSDFGVIGISGCTPRGTLPLDGSDGAPVPSSSGPVGSSFLATYPEGVAMRGWYLKTGAEAGSEGRDPAYFKVWGTNDFLDHGDGSCALGKEGEERWWKGGDRAEWCGARWRRVGSPHWRFQSLNSAGANREESGWWDFLQIEISLPKERGSLETFLLIPPWNLYGWYWVFPQLVMGPAVILTGLSARLRPHLGRIVPDAHTSLAFGVSAACLCSAASGLVNGLAGTWHVMWESLATAFSMSFLSVAFTLQGPSFVYAMWGYAAAQILSWMALCQWFWRSPVQRPTLTGLIGLLLSVVVTLLRARSLFVSKRMLKGDQDKYQKVWLVLMGDPEGAAAVAHLDKVVHMVGLDDRAPCRQHNRLRADRLGPAQRERWLLQQPEEHPRVFPLFLDIAHWYSPGRPDPKSPVTGVNQLYAASAVCYLLLEQRVRVWAEGSNGMVRLTEAAQGGEDREGREGGKSVRGRFAKWTVVRDDPVLMGRVMATALKRHSRAIEKLLRNYGNHPSLLLDICRNAIVFSTMADLTACLGAIVADENVKVERIKNRMSPSHDPDTTGGYRDVLINLRVVSEEARELGTELTVCELQLMLEDIALLKTAEGHKRYVVARNDMGV